MICLFLQLKKLWIFKEKIWNHKLVHHPSITPWHWNGLCIICRSWGKSTRHLWIPPTKGRSCGVLVYTWPSWYTAFKLAMTCDVMPLTWYHCKHNVIITVTSRNLHHYKPQSVGQEYQIHSYSSWKQNIFLRILHCIVEHRGRWVRGTTRRSYR